MSGILYDINQEYLKAISEYEIEIREATNILNSDSYVNLAFLYWSVAFLKYEFNLPNKINDSVSKIGGERYQKILDLGMLKFPNNRELKFWNLYFNHISSCIDFPISKCEELVESVKSIDDNLVPYFFLMINDFEKYGQYKIILLDMCNSSPTAKNLYIKSIIK